MADGRVNHFKAIGRAITGVIETSEYYKTNEVELIMKILKLSECVCVCVKAKMGAVEIYT